MKNESKPNAFFKKNIKKNFYSINSNQLCLLSCTCWRTWYRCLQLFIRVTRRFDWRSVNSVGVGGKPFETSSEKYDFSHDSDETYLQQGMPVQGYVYITYGQFVKTRRVYVDRSLSRRERSSGKSRKQFRYRIAAVTIILLSCDFRPSSVHNLPRRPRAVYFRDNALLRYNYEPDAQTRR